jgi:hypothetical protein
MTPDFEVYVEDDRYSVPSLYLITAPSEARARAMAEEMWRSSDHHLGVEVRRDGERIFALGTLATDTIGASGAREAPSP